VIGVLVRYPRESISSRFIEQCVGYETVEEKKVSTGFVNATDKIVEFLARVMVRLCHRTEVTLFYYRPIPLDEFLCIRDGCGLSDTISSEDDDGLDRVLVNLTPPVYHG